MSKMRRFAAIAAAAAMTACMAVPMMAVMPVSAADQSTITISGAVTGSEYAGYKLFDLSQSGENYSYTVNTKYTAILQTVTGMTTDADILAYIGGLTGADVQTFADNVYKAIKANGLESDSTLSATEATTVDQGYYLVVETKTGESDPDDTYSLAMLDTAGDANVTITTKESTPTLIKKLKDVNDSVANSTTDWQDGADYDIGDTVPFQLTGTVSSKYANYNEYYYAFHDTMCEGLTFDENSVVVTVDGATLTGGYNVVTTGLTDGCTFEIQFPDLKKVEGATVTADSNIVVYYEATLNQNAEINFTGNPNVADLEYSINPYFTGGGTTGKDENEETGFTPEDQVIVFTYQTVVKKVDSAHNPLTGAEFTLEKKVVTDAGTSWVPLTLVKNADGDTFTFTGLDDGDYRLTETQAPEGYNKLNAAIEFTVTAEHDITADAPVLNKLSGSTPFVYDATDGLVAEIENKSGSVLPGTGGIGTTLFYVVGGTLVAGAGVTLIAKKRMKKED